MVKLSPLRRPGVVTPSFLKGKDAGSSPVSPIMLYRLLDTSVPKKEKRIAFLHCTRLQLTARLCVRFQLSAML